METLKVSQNIIEKIGKWYVKLSNDKTELIIDNGNDCCYAFYDMKKDILYFDRIICPKYVQKFAKRYGKRHNMIDIYNN